MERRSRIPSAGILVLAALLATAGCGEDDNEQGDVRKVSGLSSCEVKTEGYYYIGEVQPMTGVLGGIGVTLARATDQSVAEINAAGGIHGKTVGIIICDTETDPVTAVEAVTELADADPVSAIIGPATSSGVVGAADVAKTKGIPVITSSGTSPELTGLDDGGYVFRTCASDAVQGAVAARLAEREGFTKVFVINRDDAYGNGLREVFVQSFTALGGQADHVAYSDGDPGYERTVIDAATAYDPDAVFLVSYVDDGAAIVKTAVTDGWAPEWILPDGPKNPEFITKVGNDTYLEGVLGTSPATPTGEDYQAFEAAYQDMWGEAPMVFNANSYDAGFLVGIAMELSEDPDNGQQIRDNLAHTSSGTAIHPGEWAQVLTVAADGEMDYAGASGPVDFDANGDVLSNIEEWTITNGEIVSVGCLTPEGDPCP